MANSTTNKELYIVETSEPFSSLEIQFVPPQINNSRDAKLQTFTVVGRNDDLMHYISGSEKLDLELDFLSNEENRKDVYEKINWLKSLTMNDGYAGKIRNVKLVFGELFKNHIWIIKTVNPKMTNLSQPHGWMPLRASVTINLILDPEKNRYIEDVRNGR